jgi:hypothetical protein
MAAVKKLAKKKRPAAARPAAKKAKKNAASARVKKPASRAKSGAAARRKPVFSLGRVKVPVDARLDVVFQKDYQAREIFDFLKVTTIRELETFAPGEIIERLTGPMVQTVERIRKTLALANRHLARDERFAKDFLSQVRQAR